MIASDLKDEGINSRRGKKHREMFDGSSFFHGMFIDVSVVVICLLTFCVLSSILFSILC